MSTTANYEEIQKKGRCNWCREWLIMSEPVTQANLVDVGKKHPALFCSKCLADDFRRGQPKMCFNVITFDEYYIEDLPDKEGAAAPQQQTQETPQTEET
jgi:hypothetical protein